ncbi:MAG: tetratricopeptide repeat protein [Steroidobacteraceae bacterium]
MLSYLIPILISLGLIVHAIKTGRNTIWVFLFVFTALNPITSLLCWAAYFIVEIVPDLLKSRTARRAASGLRATVDPHRDLREANQQLAVNNSVDSRRKVADQLLERGRYDEAIEHYRAAMTGIYTHEPLLMLGLAKAQFAKNQIGEARKTLDELIANNPDFKSPEGHLLYARALESEGNLDKALAEYKALSKYYSGAEAVYRYASLLKRQGQSDKANVLFKELLANAELAGVVFRKENREWIDAAKRELG